MHPSVRLSVRHRLTDRRQTFYELGKCCLAPEGKTQTIVRPKAPKI